MKQMLKAMFKKRENIVPQEVIESYGILNEYCGDCDTYHKFGSCKKQNKVYCGLCDTYHTLEKHKENVIAAETSNLEYNLNEYCETCPRDKGKKCNCSKKPSPPPPPPARGLHIWQ